LSPPSLVKGVLPHEHGFLARNEETPEQITALGKKIGRRLEREFRALVAGGVNLFVECTMNSPERRPELWAEAGRKTGMHYMLGETTVYRPEAMYGRRRAAEGAFGDFVYAEGEYLHDVDAACNLREVRASRLAGESGPARLKG